MKRIQLFEFEDFDWWPNWLRDCMTSFIVSMHKLLGTSEHISDLLDRALKEGKTEQLIDLCSGGGGPMKSVVEDLKTRHGHSNLKMKLTDLFPNKKAAERINNANDPSLTYVTTSVDAAKVPDSIKGVRTMICSMHHMPVPVAKSILSDAADSMEPICVFEISDNSFPKWIWWVAFPINILTTLLITPLVRPLTWQQIVFTYLIPILPIVIAWDGAVSNARTYTMEDWDIVLKDVSSENYTWEKGIIKGKAKFSYLLGFPKT